MDKDLVVLVEGRSDKKTIEALLNRPEAFGIRALTFDVYAHPQSGPGCLNEAAPFFRAISALLRYQYALVVFDREGCGRDKNSAQQIEEEVTNHLQEHGWGNRVGVVVIDPELEAWIWSSSTEVVNALGWQNHDPSLWQWLESNHHVSALNSKPSHPKETLQSALKEVRKGYSASIHAHLASTVSTRRCTDESFRRFKTLLTNWFSLPPDR